ncbi:MAG: Crp/Fnr family transcriptional regulator [Bacteroides sp.]|nr:Crp/Fnr family transcriptional regulator [Bacteroides sp.]
MDALKKETVNAVAKAQFPEMSYDGKLELEELLVRQEVAKGEILLREGEISRDLILVGKGMLRQFYHKHGKDVTEHFSYEGCVLMCLESMLKQEPTRLMVEALEDSVIYRLSYNKLMTLCELSAEINRFYRKILEFSLITSQVKADAWRFENANERYLRLFKEHPEVIKRAPLSDIASYLLMTPETLSRVRAGM